MVRSHVRFLWVVIRDRVPYWHNLSLSFNYTPYLFYKKRFKTEVNSFCMDHVLLPRMTAWLVATLVFIQFNPKW